MAEGVEKYWDLRLENCQQALQRNNFEAYVVNSPVEAQIVFFREIYPKISVSSVSWGDSITLRASGILDELQKDPKLEIIKTFEQGVPREELIERRRQALLVDLFFTGTNALTEDGKLVNLDMVGNRVGALTFGPRYVVLLIGRNKLVTDYEAGMHRVKEVAAPQNAILHEGWKTPCRKTSFCHDCSSPDRICNTWTITEKSFPKHRIKIILINEDLGL
ncbi:MAG: lactate utilization protein [Desulfobulbaceae bacterium]|nr:MAG: lactate utilization protein [Desulfobulbaceae bacterium]